MAKIPTEELKILRIDLANSQTKNPYRSFKNPYIFKNLHKTVQESIQF